MDPTSPMGPNFEYGNIQQSGTYRIIENFTSDIHAGDLDAPNPGGKQWKPMAAQSGQYPATESWCDDSSWASSPESAAVVGGRLAHLQVRGSLMRRPRSTRR